MGSMQEQQVTGDGNAQVGWGHAPAHRPLPSAPKSGLTQAILAHTVEQHVIPHLLLARRTAPAGAPAAVTAAQVDELVRLLMARDEAGATAFAQGLHAAGCPAETLYLDLLAPAARKLGQLWVDDECDFTDVTVGLFLLQASMRELGAAAESGIAPNPAAPRILLVPMPGEQHTFGLSIVYDFFRRAGWNAWSDIHATAAELTATVRKDWFDVIGLSLACGEQLDDARAVIGAIRAASRNPGVAILAGGPVISANPALASAVGADGTAPDASQAVGAAEALLAHTGWRSP